MTSQVSYRVDTPCGFEIWLIPLENGTVRLRAFFESKEVSMDSLSGKLSKEGLLKIADKAKEIYHQPKE